MAAEYQLTAQQLLEHRWYSKNTKPADLPRILFSMMTWLDGHQRHYRERDFDNWRMYDNDAALRAMGRRTPRRDEPRLTLNLVRSCVNAVHGKIIQTKPRPTYLTIGQGHRARERAKKTQAYSDGLIYHANAYAVGADDVRQAGIFGNGSAHTYRGCDGKPKVESLGVHEVKVEHADGKKRDPRVVYIHRPVVRDELLERFGNDRAARKIIEAAPPAKPDSHIFQDELADQIMVIEAYRRPVTTGGEGGKHVIVLENGVVCNDDWKRPTIPVRTLRWGIRPLGFRGYGIGDQCESLQLEVNWTLLAASEQFRLAGPKVFVERGSAINLDEISNEIWGIIEYSGTAPTYSQFQSVDPALLQHVANCRTYAFEEIGLNEMSAQGQKPPGLNSGKALMTYSDLETAKFVDFGQRYEQHIKEIADDLLDTALEDSDDDSAVEKILSPTRKYRRHFLQEVSRKDVEASRDERICQIFPTSQLAQQPAQKMQQVADMQGQGWIQPTEAMQLLDFPDIDNATALATAPLEYVDMCIDRMLEDGVVMRPEPWIDLKMARERVTHAALRAQIEQAPEERWQLLIAYADACSKELAKQAAPPPGAAPPGAALPPGGPPAAPQLPPGAPGPSA